jgi:hypothetical protein
MGINPTKNDPSKTMGSGISKNTIMNSLKPSELDDFKKGLHDPNAFDACAPTNVAFDATNSELSEDK